MAQHDAPEIVELCLYAEYRKYLLAGPGRARPAGGSRAHRRRLYCHRFELPLSGTSGIVAWAIATLLFKRTI
jgi:hypothetical protein